MSGEQRDDGDSCSGISASAAQKALPSNVNTMIVTSSDRSQPIGNTRSSTNNSNDNDNDSGADAATPPHDIQRELNKTNLRRGKWTTEEEAYARAVICDFNSGYLDAPIGTTLRAFLSGKLECDPMRITKKFTKDDSIGKKVFRPATQNDPKVAKDVKDSQAKVAALYQNWKQKIESQLEETNRKSSVEPSLTGGITLTSKNSLDDMPQTERSIAKNVSPELMTLVHRTADWLEKADYMLSKKLTEGRPAEEKATEMKEIKSLIEQGPAVLAAAGDVTKLLNDAKSKGLPSRLHSCPDFRKIAGSASPTSKKRKHPLIDDELVKKYDNNPINLLASLSSRAAPVPVSIGNAKQRKREGSDVNTEDAKAFVNFLQSVAHE